MVNGVGAPWRPPRCSIGVEAEAIECMADAEIVGEECVGMSEATHHHIVSGPRANAIEGEQLAMSDRRLASHVELDVPRRHGGCDATDRVSPSAGHRERLSGGGGQFPGSGEDVSDTSDRVGQRTTGRVHDPSCDRPCSRHRHLLADHCSDRRLVRVGAGRSSPFRRRPSAAFAEAEADGDEDDLSEWEGGERFQRTVESGRL